MYHDLSELCVSLAFLTVKSLLEAFILAPTNPQYDERLFIDVQVQYMKITSLEHCLLVLF